MDVPTNSLPCRECRTAYRRTAEHWHRAPSNKDGLSYICKACAQERAQTYYQNHREAILERQNARLRERREMFSADPAWAF
ncbi:hypothetical protein [Streptomyces sp. SPB78]|uniref:hypothetical protein n=1 Tax=Streptomyces sp. (strain SPB78) TaxID=591157 RepID=UPI0001B553AF|nr:hypothetical protein [Streptomyces sp. SPB78]